MAVFVQETLSAVTESKCSCWVWKDVMRDIHYKSCACAHANSVFNSISKPYKYDSGRFSCSLWAGKKTGLSSSSVVGPLVSSHFFNFSKRKEIGHVTQLFLYWFFIVYKEGMGRM